MRITELAKFETYRGETKYAGPRKDSKDFVNGYVVYTDTKQEFSDSGRAITQKLQAKMSKRGEEDMKIGRPMDKHQWRQMLTPLQYN